MESLKGRKRVVRRDHRRRFQSRRSDQQRRVVIVAAAKAGPEGVPIRYVEIGSISGPDITLPSAALRSSSLQLMGSGLSSVPLPRLLAAIEGVLNAAPAAGLAAAIKLEPLANISQAWAEETGARIVLVP